MLTRDELAEAVIRHLVSIVGGSCSIDAAAIEESFSEDPAFSEILMGLRHLHEDLIYREMKHLDVEEALRSALAVEKEKNKNLQRAIVAAELVSRNNP